MCKRFHAFRTPLFVLVVLCAALHGRSDAAELTTALTTSKFSVGDRIRFTVALTGVPKGAVVTPPATESDFGSAVKVKEWNLHKTEQTGADSLLYDYIITTYIPEPCTIPVLSFIIVHDGTTDTLRTDPLPLSIVSVLPSDTVDIIGLKSPLTAGKKPLWWLWVLIITGGIAVVAIATILIVKHFRKPPPPPPPVPPYEEAIDALSVLGVKKYRERGLVREYVFELSDIFKRYIGRRYECNAMDFTTEELFAWSGAAALDKNLRSIIDWFFGTTDPVKFARLIPDSETVDRFDREVRQFLEATKPVAVLQPPVAEVKPVLADAPAQKSADTKGDA